MLISLKKASQMLGVSEQTLRNWDNQGKLKALRTPGNVRRYEEDTIKEFIDKMRGENNVTKKI